MSDDQPNVIALLLIGLVGLAVAGGFAVFGFTTLARHGIRHAKRETVLRGFAGLAAAAAAAMYVWGALHLVKDESMTTEACRAAVGRAHAADITGSDVSYLPLHLNCHVRGAGSYAAAVPDYVNPAVLGLALTAVALGVFAAFASELRARDNFRKEKAS
ncbi:hypothetical protein [Streptomyces sp. NBC_00203]|uniref:hypothetical protein n=1 Tax=unclassified Streptomyces TaxID=2593676 RepID=UPI003246AB6D